MYCLIIFKVKNIMINKSLLKYDRFSLPVFLSVRHAPSAMRQPTELHGAIILLIGKKYAADNCFLFSIYIYIYIVYQKQENSKEFLTNAEVRSAVFDAPSVQGST